MRIGDAVSTYTQDEAIIKTPTAWIWLTGLFVVLVVFPFLANAYFLYLACLVGIAIISATGLNILSGFTGLISLGQAGFMGVGAYTAAWLSINLDWPFEAAFIVAVVMTMIVGVLVGLPSLRIKGLYLAISTMAASVIFAFIFVHGGEVTGGDRGLSLKSAVAFGIDISSNFAMYYIILPIMLLTVVGARNLFRTRVGRAFIAIRDRDISAEVLGINLLRYKLISFGISSGFAGAAGVLTLYFFKVVTPESFPLSLSIFYLAAIIVGGMGTILGGILGAAFMTLIPEFLGLVGDLLTPFYPQAPVVLAPFNEVLFGAFIVGFLLFEPDGLTEIWRRVRRYFHLWPFRT